MLLGPIFHRELVITPRRSRIYTARTVYALALMILTATVWLVLTGSQNVRDPGDMARFGTLLFSLLAPLQLVLAMFFSAMFAAGNVSQEKDRNTLVLLLLTRMNNTELVLGKLAGSLLHLCVNLLAGMPVFFMVLIFGGVDVGQVFRCFAVTLAATILCGSLGTMIAFWREQTFQAISITVLILVAWLAFWEVVAAGVYGASWGGIPTGFWAVSMSPWRAIFVVTQAFPPEFVWNGVRLNAAWTFPCVAAVLSCVMAGWTVLRVRVWNPSRELFRARGVNRPSVESEEWRGELNSEKSTLHTHRPVWDNPVLWRETSTYAYGKKAFFVRLAYTLLFLAAAVSLHRTLGTLGVALYSADPAVISLAAVTLLPLALLSLVLINAQAVTAITGERDARTLDLLRVTELSPKEIVFGKLGGIFWNTREMILWPAALILYFYFREIASLEIAVYLLGGFLALVVFAAMLGIHAGMAYAGSRSAIGVSLGTIFFLFIGVAVCLRMMLAMGDSFQAQIQPFLAIMVGGGIAMYLALGARNPSPAIALACFGCPFATFYAITALMMNYTLGIFLVVSITYGFTTAAMLIPAISEFDIAERTPQEE